MARKPQPRKAAKAEPPERVLAAALELAASRGWAEVALADIAAAAELSLAELYALYPSKAAILAAFSRDVDRRVLAGVGEAVTAEDETARDRLFDVLMRRFDALDAHKAGVEAVLRASRSDPLAVVAGTGQLLRSMSLMLESAGISSTGLVGLLRTKALAAIYLATMRDWLRDDTADKAKTMAALDGRLRRAERCASTLDRRPRFRGGEPKGDRHSA
jgi:AcrR family transcriptional regulator